MEREGRRRLHELGLGAPRVRLITIAISHYCEKARWALERAGLSYREEPHAPVLHVRHSKGAGGGDSVPVLCTGDAVLADSTDILRWVDGRANLGLYPGAEAAELEEYFDETLGPHVRRLVYRYVLEDGALTRQVLTTGVSRGERLAYRVMQPGITFFMRRMMNITPASAERSHAKVVEAFDRVDALLADGRRWLTGDRFTAADLTFAALGAPVLGPENYGPQGVGLPAPSVVLPAAYREVVRPLLERPAGRYIARLYAEERRRAPVAAAT